MRGRVLLIARVTNAQQLQPCPDNSPPEVILEIRADLLGDLPAAQFRDRPDRRLLYTLRSVAEGGSFAGTTTERRTRLSRASESYDLIDLEGEQDLYPALLQTIEASRRLISWTGPVVGVDWLQALWRRFSRVPAKLYRFACEGARPGQEIDPLLLLKSLGRDDVVAFSNGRGGLWTRLVAAQLGAPVVFGTFEEAPPDGEPSIFGLARDFGLPNLSPFDELHGIVGSNAFRSLSPRLHNAAHRCLRRRALFVPFDVESMVDFWRATVISGKLESIGLRINGLTITSPFKEAAISLAGECSFRVKRAGSTNIVTRVNGQWRADTTDPEGVLSNLTERRIPVRERPVAVVGCGGSGRAVAGALKDAGADVTLVNRGLERGRFAVELLDLPFVPLSRFSAGGFSLVVNATPVGRDDDELPFCLDALVQDAVIVDHVYRIGSTPLIAATRASGRVGIEGREVLRQQVMRQYRLMNGVDMPAESMEALLGLGDRPTVAAAGVSWT